MTHCDQALKRGFDITVSACGLLVLWPLILLAWAVARHDTGASGFFCQERVGRRGTRFKMIKLRTMRAKTGMTVTTVNDARITPIGAWFRRWKIDEVPQLWNVLRGEMSLVGPRPSVPGFLDRLEGQERQILELRPGMTGPATLKYRNEEHLLAKVADPETFNRNVIWPDKVRLNLAYLENWSFREDLSLIVKTIVR